MCWQVTGKRVGIEGKGAAAVEGGLKICDLSEVEIQE